MEKFGKTIGHELDKAGRKIDSNVSKAIGMEEGTKISHATNRESAHHKDAVTHLKGEDDSPEVVEKKVTIVTKQAEAEKSSSANAAEESGGGTSEEIHIAGQGAHHQESEG